MKWGGVRNLKKYEVNPHWQLDSQLLSAKIKIQLPAGSSKKWTGEVLTKINPTVIASLKI